MNVQSFDIQSIFKYDIFKRAGEGFMIGNKILRFEELESTNSFSKLNYESIEHGAIVLSNKQTKGKGRNNKIWLSESGNLYFSIVLKKDISLKKLFRFVSITSLAILKTLEEYQIVASIKYPNDILVNNKKIAGILMESAGDITALNYLIIGVGVNVNQLDFGELKYIATSIRENTSTIADIDRILLKFIHNYNELSVRDFEEIYDKYLKNSMVIGKSITYDNEQYIITDIDINGAIILQNGTIKRKVVLNEISLGELYE